MSSALATVCSIWARRTLAIFARPQPGNSHLHRRFAQGELRGDVGVSGGVFVTCQKYFQLLEQRRVARFYKIPGAQVLDCLFQKRHGPAARSNNLSGVRSCDGSET